MCWPRPSKKEAEDEHGCQRLQDCPGRAQDRLLVPDLDVAPGQEEKELAIAPEFPQIEEVPAVTTLDDRHGQGSRRTMLGRSRTQLAPGTFSTNSFGCDTHDTSTLERDRVGALPGPRRVTRSE